MTQLELFKPPATRKRTKQASKPPPPTVAQAEAWNAMVLANAAAVEERMRQSDLADREFEANQKGVT